MSFRLPSNDEHTAVVGRTGSGKTQLGIYLLGKQNLKRDVWYVLDYKGDDLIAAIDRARHIDFHETPDAPGLYVLHSRPDQSENTENWLWKVWEKERAGLYVDEGYMVPDIGAYQAILTQGRSKRIPMINLSQRPVAINRFVFSEAAHIVVFDLNDDRDEKTVSGFTPRGFMDWMPDGIEAQTDQFDQKRRLLPKFHSRWWNVKDREGFLLQPVPGQDELIETINSQLEPKRRWL